MVGVTKEGACWSGDSGQNTECLCLASPRHSQEGCAILIVSVVNFLVCWSKTLAIDCSAGSLGLCALGGEEKKRSASLRSNSAISLVARSKGKATPLAVSGPGAEKGTVSAILIVRSCFDDGWWAVGVEDRPHEFSCTWPRRASSGHLVSFPRGE